uniref:Uncharacterized protein n=1 Tax=Arundo donax TaxID=35708 RepID=A0A0A9EKR2_ARUDO
MLFLYLQFAGARYFHLFVDVSPEYLEK